MDLMINLLLILPNLKEESVSFHSSMDFISENNNVLAPYHERSLKHYLSKDI